MRSGDFRTSYPADMAIFDSPVSRWALGVFVVALVVLPLFGTSYWMDVANRVGIAVIAAMGLNVLTGFTGQISLGNAAFLAVGAYTTAALAAKNVPFIFVLPASGLVSALVGMVFGVPSLRLKGLYLAIATLAAHFIVQFTVTPWDSMTGAVNRITISPAPPSPLPFPSHTTSYHSIPPP